MGALGSGSGGTSGKNMRKILPLIWPDKWLIVRWRVRALRRAAPRLACFSGDRFRLL